MAKRSASVLDERFTPTKRAGTHCNPDAIGPNSSLTVAPNALEIRAFGLEDRAEAVIAQGKDNWTLANLSKWRHDSLDVATAAADDQCTSSDSKISSKEYLRQRQRAYRQQCLASNRDQHK